MAVAVWVFLAACGPGEEAAPQAPPASAPEPAARLAPSDAPAKGAGREIVAIVNGDSVTAEELDDPIRIRLYDLARVQYEARLERLRALAVEKILAPRAAAARMSLPAFIAREAEAFAPGSAERRSAYLASVLEGADLRILLEPPEPPKFDLRATDGPVRGAANAPVTIVGFIDYQSPHARRAQPVIRRLLDAYDGRLRYAVRDLPMQFHRHARLAAEAARCAGEQGAYWRYHDLLFQNQQELERPALERYARMLELDIDAFSACLGDGRQASGVTADVTEAARLGVSNVPTFFVNGRYVKGVEPYEEFQRLVDAELVRLGLLAGPGGAAEEPADEAYADARESELPLILVGTLVMSDADRSTASIRHEDGEVASTYRPGSKVMKDVELVKVERERVYLRNTRRGDSIEYLPLARGATGAPAAVAVDDATAPDPGVPAEPDEEEAERSLPPPDVIVSLSRGEIDRGLDNREALEQSLQTGKLDLEGQRLLKLSEVPPGSLYEKLGLQPGDVLMRVNGEWITDQRNPLWEALAAPEGKIVLRFMRNGFPHAVEYRIE